MQGAVLRNPPAQRMKRLCWMMLLGNAGRVGRKRAPNGIVLGMAKGPENQRERRSFLARMGLGTWRGRILWVVGLLLVTVVTCWVLARTTPSWYRTLDPDDKNVMEASERGWAKII